MSGRKCSVIDNSTVMAGSKMVSQNIFSIIYMILHSWNSAIKEVGFTFENMYICRISLEVVFQRSLIVIIAHPFPC